MKSYNYKILLRKELEGDTRLQFLFHKKDLLIGTLPEILKQAGIDKSEIQSIINF